MHAIQVSETGGPEKMEYVEIAMPEPGPGQARLKVAAAGINFIDVYHRTGQYKSALPLVLGQEAAGVVDAVGPGVTEVKVGDHVAFAPSTGGAYAEYVVVAAAMLVPVPSGVALQLAAAVMLQGMTAHYLSHSTYPIQPGDEVLVHAAAGGVGQLLVQLAKQRGAWVVATVGRADKVQIARAAGADEVINYNEQDFAAEIKRLTNGAGLHAVYDSVGKDTFEGSLNSLRKRGYLVLFGQSSGAVSPVDPQVLNAKGSLFLTRPKLGDYTPTREELLERAESLFNWIAEGKLRVSIARTFPLAEAADAHRFLESRQATGKILLIP